MHRFTLTSAFLFLGFSAWAQLGGQQIFRSLTTPVAPRIAGVGGFAHANPEDDLHFGMINPALLSPDMHNLVGMSFAALPAGIRFSDATYARSISDRATISYSLKYLHYGDFTRATDLGQIIGEFSASEYMAQVGYGYRLDSNWQVGANVKLLNGVYDIYNSWAAAVDVGVVYQLPKSRYVFTLLARNAGFQLKTFDGVREEMPFQLDFSVSKKLEHVPIRWFYTFENLQTWDLRYDDPNAVETDPITGEVTVNEPGVFNNIMRHSVVGAELSPQSSLNVQIGYRFRRQFEMRMPTRRVNAGFTFGLGFRVYKFRLNYANTSMNVAGRMHHISIITALDDFKKSKPKPDSGQ